MGTFLALTGKRLDTTDIIRAGLATHFISSDSLSRFEQETGTKFVLLQVTRQEKL